MRRVIQSCVQMWSAATSMMCRARHAASRTFLKVVDAASIWEADAHLLPVSIAHHDRLDRALNAHRALRVEAVAAENALHAETAAAALDRLNEVAEIIGN